MSLNSVWDNGRLDGLLMVTHVQIIMTLEIIPTNCFRAKKRWASTVVGQFSAPHPQSQWLGHNPPIEDTAAEWESHGGES